VAYILYFVAIATQQCVWQISAQLAAVHTCLDVCVLVTGLESLDMKHTVA
jgi:hypothetical protein